MKRWILSAFLSVVLIACPASVMAQEGEVLGIHILNTYELDNATSLVKTDDDSWHYVTVPLSLEDIKDKDKWQGFFDAAKSKKLIPIVRLVTEVENGSWQVANQKEIVDMVDFLNELNWPTENRYIIVFNEPNHSKEWGGRIDPEEYAKVLKFTANWAHATDSRFKVLPAGLDLAAPNGSATMEAFTYLEKMYQAEPDVFSHIDYWNSHSYPNPGFSAAATRDGKNSLRGFTYELAYLKEKTGQDYQVFITETGWVENRYTAQWLESYYIYALQHIWSDARVVAVTPFLLQGAPGPFSEFSFIDGQGKPTLQFIAYQNAVKKVKQGS